ncbi:hypothetical protein HWV62_25 [Athelia sp. TMB]|nr:hypothetical protein HWV62_25 [Athelia sp. TMB]
MTQKPTAPTAPTESSEPTEPTKPEEPKESQKLHTTKNNIIVFGQTGAGKSSLVNMVLGEDRAMTSDGSQSCTSESSPYEVVISGKRLTLWDTPGFDDDGDPIDPTRPKVSGKNALVSVYRLIEKLDEGISLVVFCVRGPRLTSSVVENYKLFHSAFGRGKVPIVLIVTGLEQKEPMDDWWLENKEKFHNRGMIFGGQACVTASRGKIRQRTGLGVYQNEFDESKDKVRKLLVGQYSSRPWKMEKAPGVLAAVRRGVQMFANIIGITAFGVPEYDLYQTLRADGLSDEEATRLVYIDNEKGAAGGDAHAVP